MRRQRRWWQNPKTRWRTLGVLVLISLLVILKVLWNEFFLDNSKEVPKSGGIYTEATVGTVQNLNPLAPSSSFFDKDVQALIFEGLLKYNPITKEIEDALGNLTVSENGKLYEVTLKEDLKFSDGKDLDIADVLFTYSTLLKNPGLGNNDLYQAFEYIEINVVDDRTISFRLPEQNVFFKSLLTIPILPQSAFENTLIEEVLDPDYPFNRRPIGAGPFKLKNIIPEDEGLYRVFLDKNHNYHRGEPYVEQVVLYAYESPERLVYDHRWPTSFSRLSQQLIDQIEPNLYAEYQRINYVLPRFSGVFFNLDRSIVRLPTFRKALSMAFDRDKILEGDWKPLKSPFFIENVTVYEPLLDYTQARIQLRDNGFPYNKEKEARTEGKEGETVRLKLLTSTVPAVYSRFAQKLVNAWEDELYIEIDLIVLPPEEFAQALHNRDYDMVLFGQNFSDNFDVLSVWHSSQSDLLNLSNFTRDDVDFMIDEIRFTGSYQDYQTLQDKIDDLNPALFLGTPAYQALQSIHLKGGLEDWSGIRSLSHRFAVAHLWHFETEFDWDFAEGKWLVVEFLHWLIGGKN